MTQFICDICNEPTGKFVILGKRKVCITCFNLALVELQKPKNAQISNQASKERTNEYKISKSC